MWRSGARRSWATEYVKDSSSRLTDSSCASPPYHSQFQPRRGPPERRRVALLNLSQHLVERVDQNGDFDRHVGGDGGADGILLLARERCVPSQPGWRAIGRAVAFWKMEEKTKAASSETSSTAVTMPAYRRRRSLTWRRSDLITTVPIRLPWKSIARTNTSSLAENRYSSVSPLGVGPGGGPHAVVASSPSRHALQSKWRRPSRRACKCSRTECWERL